MKAITKKSEPNLLKQYRLQPGSIYDGHNFTTVKDAIRAELLAEQDHLCAYCMQRIYEHTMKIEHWRSQTYYPNQQLQYGNMLGCCQGNEGSRPNEQHCDTKKGDKDIKFNPAQPSHHPRMKIRYAGDGTVRSEDEQFDDDINHVLNLNWARLKKNRAAVHQAVTRVLNKKPGARSGPELDQLIARWKAPDSNGCLTEYCDVAVYYLEKKIAKKP